MSIFLVIVKKFKSTLTDGLIIKTYTSINNVIIIVIIMNHHLIPLTCLSLTH